MAATPQERLDAPLKLKKVAIVGSGCAGIGALWALNRTHHDVYMFEAAGRLGGHTNTVEWKKGNHKTLVDTGFIILNTVTYPNFLAFLKAIKVPTASTEMTFGVSRDQGAFEWAGTSLSAVFAQRKNIFSPRVWRMLFDIIRFNQFALDLLRQEDKSEAYVNGDGNSNGVHKHKSEMSIGDFLDAGDYSEGFRDDYLIPMTAAVWSTSPDKCSLEFPALTLVRFMYNHHLLNTITERPPWLTLKNCGQSYINAVMKGFPPNHLFLNTPVKSVTNDASGKVLLHLENGKTETFDHVILATHGDTALDIISASATPAEQRILSAFTTSKNTAVLHSDLSLMPRRRLAWSAWNYMTLSSNPSTSRTPSRSGNIDHTCLTYNMNKLQGIPTTTFGDVLVTLNPLHEPNPALVQGRYSYSHPKYTAAAVRAQDVLPQIQNRRGISYAGAWTKYGFHEDGFSSGLKVAVDHLGATLPFEFRDSTFSRGRRPVLTSLDVVLRLLLVLVQAGVMMLVALRQSVDAGVRALVPRWLGEWVEVMTGMAVPKGGGPGVAEKRRRVMKKVE